MTQMRFINKKGRKLGENFYMRADGTRTYFFSKGIPFSSGVHFPSLTLFPEILESMFNQVGFDTSVVKYNTRELRNRKRKLSMYRYELPFSYSLCCCYCWIWIPIHTQLNIEFGSLDDLWSQSPIITIPKHKSFFQYGRAASKQERGGEEDRRRAKRRRRRRRRY